MVKKQARTATPDVVVTPLTAGQPVRVNRDAKLHNYSNEPHDMAGRDGTVLQVLPSGDMVQVEIGGESVILKVTEVTPLIATTGAIAFSQESPALLVHSLTNPRRRKGLDIESLNAFAANIKVLGILQPILVRQLPAARMEDTAHLSPRPVYEIVAGERRWRGAMIAGLATVPLLVRELSDEAVWEMQVAENIEREDLDDLEEAEGFAMMRDKLGMTILQIAERTGKGKGPSYITKSLKLCDLTEDSRSAMYAEDGQEHPVLTRSVALLVARYEPKKQAEVVAYVKSLARAGGEPAPFRDVSPALFKRFNLVLSQAVFSLTDADLCAGVPSCASCPKSSANQGEIFGDVGAEASCTDPDCFEAKRVAHVDGIRQQAIDDGYELVDGDDARKAKPSPHAKHLIGYVSVDDVSHTIKTKGIERDVTFGAALLGLGKKAPKPLLFVDQHSGATQKVIPIALARTLTPKEKEVKAPAPAPAKPAAQGKAAAPAPYVPQRSTTPEEDALEVAGVQRACYLRLFESVRGGQRTAEELRLVASALFGYGERNEETETYIGWAEQLENVDPSEASCLVQDLVAGLPQDMIGAYITMAALERYLRHYMTSDLDAIALFKRYGIDVLAVRDKVAEDMQGLEDEAAA